jgi:hypothetical protein
MESHTKTFLKKDKNMLNYIYSISNEHLNMNEEFMKKMYLQDNSYPSKSYRMDISNRIDSCENCSNDSNNNPNVSGICYCALPTLYNPIY